MTKKLKARRISQIESGWSKNHKWGAVDYDYGDSHCPMECDCDSICRQSVLRGAKVTDVDVEALANSMVLKEDRGSILHYAIERMLVANRLYDPDKWFIHISCGYYGEEITGITIDAQDSKPYVDLVNSRNELSMIRKILVEEYGYILPALEDLKKVEILEVSIDDVQPPANSYPKKISDTVYVDRELPHCVCIKDGDYYRIIDGNHRYASALSRKKKKIKIVLMS